MANPQQGTIDSVSKIYQVVEKTQYSVPVLYCFYAIDTQEQVEVIVHGAKAPNRDCKNLVEFFEALVDPIFALETVLIGQQISLAAASGNAVIPTTYGRVYKSAASFSHGKSPFKASI
jgi:hypothetical protein